MIEGGYILKARKVESSDIADAPPHVREIWDWLLRKANWRDHGRIKRGQLLTSYQEILDGLSWSVGYRKMTYKKHQCETAMKRMTKATMITTAKTTRGLIVTILNYDYYQDKNNYDNRTEADNDAVPIPTREPHDKERRNKERKELKSKEYSAFGSANAVSGNGSAQFYLTRKKRKLTGKRLTTFNELWEAYNYKKGKAEAADAWIEVPLLTDTDFQKILEAARRESAIRPDLLRQNRTPKWLQGWITGRRWEDEEYELTEGDSIDAWLASRQAEAEREGELAQ